MLLSIRWPFAASVRIEVGFCIIEEKYGSGDPSPARLRQHEWKLIETNRKCPLVRLHRTLAPLPFVDRPVWHRDVAVRQDTRAIASHRPLISNSLDRGHELLSRANLLEVSA